MRPEYDGKDAPVVPATGPRLLAFKRGLCLPTLKHLGRLRSVLPSIVNQKLHFRGASDDLRSDGLVPKSEATPPPPIPSRRPKLE